MFRPLNDAEAHQAHEKIETVCAGRGAAFLYRLKSDLVKSGDVVLLPVVHPKISERPVASPERWIESEPRFLPLDQALEALMSDPGPEAELERRRFILTEEARQVELRVEAEQERQAERARQADAAQALRNAEWAALTAEQRALHSIAKKHEVAGRAPHSWRP